eukprot:605994-Lingulodinium_polyedra.AAC.1
MVRSGRWPTRSRPCWHTGLCTSQWSGRRIAPPGSRSATTARNPNRRAACTPRNQGLGHTPWSLPN